MNIEAYILIGGRSTRLGRDKAFVEIAGTSLAETALNTVRASNVASKITFVASSDTQFAIEAITLDAPFVFDLVNERGPLGGLHTALSYARSEWILLLACDYPFIAPEFLSFLGSEISNDLGVIIPEQPDDLLQPLCAFYNVEKARPIVEEIIERPRVPPPMVEVVNALDTRIIKPEEYRHRLGCEHFFININTAADLDRMKEIERKLSAETEI